jgi:hypothetical protein
MALALGHERNRVMDGYVKAEDMVGRWNVTLRQVQMLCKAGKVDGAEKFGTTWAIPADAKKPTRTGKLKPGRKPKQTGSD